MITTSSTARTSPTAEQLASARAAYASARMRQRPTAAARSDALYAAMIAGASTTQATNAANIAAHAYEAAGDPATGAARDIDPALASDNTPGHVWIVVKRRWRGELVVLTVTECDEHTASARMQLARMSQYARQPGQSQPGDVYIETEIISRGTTNMLDDPAIYAFHEAQLALFAYFDMRPRTFDALINDRTSEAAFIRLKIASNLPVMEPRPDGPSYEIHPETPNQAAAIVCRRCGSVSHNPHDIEERYCGKCAAFHVERSA